MDSNGEIFLKPIIIANYKLLSLLPIPRLATTLQYLHGTELEDGLTYMYFVVFMSSLLIFLLKLNLNTTL